MDELDEKSKAFIERTLAKLSDDDTFRRLVGESMEKAFRFYMDTPREMFINFAREKMITGAKEHGEPQTNASKILGEIRMEHLDMLLWTCMMIEAEDESNL